MKGIFLIGWAIFTLCGIWYYFGAYIRRWWKADVVNRDLPPHQRWPEILQWQRGDEFRGGTHHAKDLVSIGDDGYAVVIWLGQKELVHLSELVGHNASARTRRIDKRLEQSHEYMDLLNEFNKAVRELEERDKKLKLVG